MGRCEPTTGIEPFGRLVHQVLAQEPYRSAERLFWIVDNGSSHRGETAKQRLRQVDSRIHVLHTPVVRKKSIPHAKRLIAKQCWMTALPRVKIDGDNPLHSKEEPRS
jgi:hypothetical protein